MEAVSFLHDVSAVIGGKINLTSRLDTYFHLSKAKKSPLAQLVERATVNREASSSILLWRAFPFCFFDLLAPCVVLIPFISIMLVGMISFFCYVSCLLLAAIALAPRVCASVAPLARGPAIPLRLVTFHVTLFVRVGRSPSSKIVAYRIRQSEFLRLSQLLQPARCIFRGAASIFFQAQHKQ